MYKAAQNVAPLNTVIRLKEFVSLQNPQEIDVSVVNNSTKID